MNAGGAKSWRVARAFRPWTPCRTINRGDASPMPPHRHEARAVSVPWEPSSHQVATGERFRSAPTVGIPQTPLF